MNNFERYVVVCKNRRQAGLLFDRIASYWKGSCHSTRGLRGRLLVGDKEKVIRDPLTCVVVISERKLFDFAYNMVPHKCRLINGLLASKWLDLKEKEKKDELLKKNQR